MKKILALLLAFVLVFSFAGCGNNDDTADGDGTGNEVVENNEGVDSEGDSASSNDGEGTSGAGDVLNPDDLYMSEDEDYSSALESEYDFGFKTASSFGFSPIVEKVDYSDMSALASVMEQRADSVAESVLGVNFEVFSEYEDIEEDEIDKLAYAIGMENDNTESRFLEAGAYHSQSTDKHYQYVMFATENFYEVNDANVDAVLESLEKAMGVSVSRSKMKKAIKEAFDTATANQDYCSLLDSDTAKGSGYSETVKLSVDAFATEENVIGYYVSCERERCYE